MRKVRTVVCLLILALTVPAVFGLRSELPPDARPMIEKKYGGWSGVLRLWVYEGWPAGAAAWLNRCAASFEKRHPGVYVQPEYVDAGALTAEGLIPPDMLLFPPGAVDDDSLAPLGLDPPLRPGLPRDPRAAPVLISGYLWAWNAAMLDALPGTWCGLSLATPPDEPYRRWSAALLALCSSRYSEKMEGDPAPRGEIGLGLPEASPDPTPTAEEGALSCALPEGFAFDDDAWQTFVNGGAAALLVTPREIRRLEALSDQGRGPDWRLGGAGAAAFTDLALYIGVVDQAEGDKLDLCRAFASHLLSEECQGELHRIDAFTVTGSEAGYAAGDSLTALERLLRQKTLIVPAPFDDDWREDASGIVRDFIRGQGDPAALTGRLAVRMRQKPEHSD